MAASDHEALTVGLHERGAIGFAVTDAEEMVGKPGGFITLKSGRLSPTYVNIRGIPSLDKGTEMSVFSQIKLREQVIAAYSQTMDETHWGYDHMMGIPHAMTALGSMVGLSRQASVLSMRTEQKTHGINKLIEGNYYPGEVVLALDDVVTDGRSKFETVSKIEEAGLEISRFVVLVDREEGGRQAMEENDLEIASVLGMGGITAVLAENGRISARQVDWTAKYFQGLVDAGIIEQMPPELQAIV